MKIQIISRETIKPSISCCSKTYDLSLLDQLAPPTYIPIVLFYSASQSRNKFSSNAIYDQLKRSLSETLAILYPLAGGIKGDSLSVEMADEGALFVRAQVNGVELSEFLENPELDLVQKFLPIHPFKVSSENTHATSIQLNMFSCGGLGIGVCISHKIADGTTLSTFLSTWAATARGAYKIAAHYFDTATIFPPGDVTSPIPCNLIKTEKVVTRRLVFTSAGLASLRAEASKNSSIDKPSLVEAVTALICKAAMKARLEITEKHTPLFVMSHVVNLRGRVSPPLAEDSFGNIWRVAIAPIRNRDEDNEIELNALVHELRKAIGKIDGEYVRKLQGVDGFYHTCKVVEEWKKSIYEEEEIEAYGFSSWVRFPLYDTDFGWGKPIWACITSVPVKNVVTLMGSKTGGMEAWVTLEEQVMAKFQVDPHLLQFVSTLNPQNTNTNDFEF